MAGVPKKERMLANQVRDLSLNLISKYLKDETPENDKFRKDLILKLATNVLPRINQIEGEDGAPIQVAITGFNYVVPQSGAGGSNPTPNPNEIPNTV